MKAKHVIINIPKFFIKKELIFLLVVMWSCNAVAQISGISASKLCVPDAGTVPVNSFELEPSVFVFNSSAKFNDAGEVKTAGGERFVSDLAFRITAGIAENLEAGTTFSKTLEQIYFGAKYSIYEQKKFKTAFIMGISLPAGNKFIPDSTNDSDFYRAVSFGVVVSSTSGDKSSIDASISLTNIFRKSSNEFAIWFGVAYGLYLSNRIQGVLEISGLKNFNSELREAKIIFSQGLTIRLSESLLAVASLQIDSLGRNIEKGTGYSMAFTMSF